MKDALPSNAVPFFDQRMQYKLESFVKLVKSLTKEDINLLLQLIVETVITPTYLATYATLDMLSRP